MARPLTSPRLIERVPPPALVVGSVGAIQGGAAVAVTLFDRLGPGGAVFLRTIFAAAVLLLIGRPSLAGHGPGELRLLALFGLTLAAMNLSIYEAFARIPLGVAVTLEFVGPLGVAVAASRRALDVVWVALAAAGVALLARGAGPSDALGIGLALLAGVWWAAYILLGRRVGRAFPGVGGLGLALALGTLALAPLGVASGGGGLLEPGLLAGGFAIAMLSSAIPYTLELEALRRMPARVFGVLASLDPAVAALAGLLFLGQGLGAREVAGIVLVVVASAGSARTGPLPARP